MKKFLLGLGVLVVLVGLSLVSTYNSLVAKTQNIDNQWAQVETQYQRRFDLIPNLVNSVKGIFTQEQEVFGAIAEARTRYSGAGTIDAKAQAATDLESALGRLLVIVENYPQLQSNTAVLSLMDELAGTENRVSVERKRYNDQVRDYNTTIKRFPTNLIANSFNFDARAYFEATPEAEQAPQVDLGQ
ncbi:MAG: LemA protein [Candidatus Beckwithbacteria bacterium GW2011_GWB1_47_15]|uniref:LemA protein n=1 Tax=Candidatus Beckwithbacteria bacterium GW2011_GWB1_47_15 TaxID=1618371 RepID=A0A0G1UTH3_9BACT|nr:MAG: lema protein, LemA protein [Candidatus Beckwithbacteria bacterium GW2011_GWC1_49_16]KKU35766.1 MAG: LemA protein [Candidatus Beckwithbacteria bacterium GW2011_GWA1_46_30]KKU61020.1 MAG: LemA protein [Candidatus Beckwithbacteria bacterium GW2011_GWB1_47_15]KKU72325.1 MAG: LemA protein [Candidatus Beckwithbacteria bacterium GW2011_GWA2_47_25]KKW04915.1 MAG: LemA protein [Candidatus Beckwithbacteria bacterium GW2011_GWC2_49_11]OGD48867.1 MAG: LemA family protein [Candidatus Beckwithbacter